MYACILHKCNYFHVVMVHSVYVSYGYGIYCHCTLVFFKLCSSVSQNVSTDVVIVLVLIPSPDKYISYICSVG